MGTIITREDCPCCGSKSIRKVLACKDHTVSQEIFDIWECADCTLRFTQDVPDQASIAPYYQSDAYISHTDTEKGLVNKAYLLARNYTLNWKMRLVQQTLGKKEKGSLLDIGAGTGAFLQQAALAGWSVRGLEPDEGARKISLEKYNLQTEAPQTLFELPSAKYDVVTMWHVLEHVHQLHEYLDQIKRVLKPQGVALIALPNWTSEDAGYYQESWAAYDVPRHLYHFTPKAMETLATQHEMFVKAVHPMWLDAFYIALLSEGYKKGKTQMVAAVWQGLRSNLNALRKKKECSSLVYILRHV